MRIFVLASLACMIAGFAGCSSPNGNVLTSEQAVSIETTQPGLVYLQAGGLSIRGVGDTAVNFDLVPQVSIRNDSNVALHLLAEWALTSSTLVRSNEQTVTVSYHPIIDSGTIDLGIIPRGSSVALDSIPIVTFSDSDLLGGQLDYSLQFQIQNGPILYRNSHMNGVPDSISNVSNPLIVYDYNLSIPFSSRYRGILYTTEASPTPIGIIDGPDDTDWQATSLFIPSAAYPNPAKNVSSLGISVPEQLDSVKCQLFITPHHVLQTIVDGTFGVGMNSFQSNLSASSPGLYRAIWTGYKNGTVVSSHGDIIVPLP